MPLAIDITVLGMRELERKLKRLEPRIQKNVVRRALRKSAKRVKARVVENLSGVKVHPRTGRTLSAFQSAPIRGFTRRGIIRVGMEFPSSESLGISKGDPYYYPIAIEYGHGKVPPHPFMRPAIDEHKSVEFMLIGRDIGHGIEREASKK